ncbi:MAG: hypothetical protein WCY37_00010 [Candidatus Dojkabacteria bacterium]
MRNEKFLENLLYDLWDNYFCDVPRRNLVVIKYGKYSRRQLGSIKLATEGTRIKGLLRRMEEDYEVQDDKTITVITITKHFQNEAVPEFVVRATIAHELCHYTHGFSSPLQKRFRNPHQGNIIDKELANRGLLEEQRRADIWLKDNWIDIISSKK